MLSKWEKPIELGIPQPFRFSGFGFDLGAILVFTIVAIVSLIESTGVYHALSEITGKKLERKDFRKGYTAEGLAIVLGSILTHFLIRHTLKMLD